MVKQDSRERSRYPFQQAYSGQDCDICLLEPLPRPLTGCKIETEHKNNTTIHNTQSMVTAGYPIPGIDFRGCTLNFHLAFSVFSQSTKTLVINSHACKGCSSVESSVLFPFLSFCDSRIPVASRTCFLQRPLFVYGIQIHIFLHTSHSFRTACP
jgi:hypothetical protein